MSESTRVRRRVDLRSDTVTRPTASMRRAMVEAEVGDDVYGEDPTVNRLEEMAAERMGKEAAVFVPSGTMANQVAVLSQIGRCAEVILEAESHIYYYEVGGLAALGGAQARPVPGKRGVMEPGDVEEAIRPENIHLPRTELICIENTHNRHGGAVISLGDMARLRKVAGEHGLPVHLDGARIFNAAAFLGVEAREIAAHANSVMFCLSKGLSAPVGSLLTGDRDFVDRARRMRKLMGGGMRQAGMLAAAGIVALEEMVDRLEEDHLLAQRLARGLAGLEGVAVNPKEVETNIVLLQLKGAVSARELVETLKEDGVLAMAWSEDCIRLVTHRELDEGDVDYALERIASALRQDAVGKP